MTRLQTPGSGVALHPTSLPGPYGIGDLGTSAHAWVDALAGARQHWWQVLPLGPTGYGDSPYACHSSCAGNANLISPDELVRIGLLSRSDVVGASFQPGRVDYGAAVPFKARLLAKAWENFKHRGKPGLLSEFEAFCCSEAAWLEDFALFTALKEAHGGGSWLEWEEALLARNVHALASAKMVLNDAIRQHKFCQFLFFRQWRALKAYANGLSVKLIGDLPMFVSTDSVDVWSHQQLFQLDSRRRPKVTVGIPPDYFSHNGQLWGNPVYEWAVMARSGYAWWVARVQASIRLFDLLRIDHFCGFHAYWEVPAGSETARQGHWANGPGVSLFARLVEALGDLPIIAEDLGLNAPDVQALRMRYGFPGMRVLQFAFDGSYDNPHLPRNYVPNTVVYTGTHDNDTTCGWYASARDHERTFLRRYAGHEFEENDPSWALIRLAWASVARVALVPLQDLLNLGTQARMNLPGSDSGWWRWRYTEDQLSAALLDRLQEITEKYGRARRSAAA